MKRLVEIADEEIRRADWIYAVDPITGQWETAWGLDEASFAETNWRGSILNVSLARNDYAGLLNLIGRVEQTRGRVSPRVQAVRQILQHTVADNSLIRRSPHVYTDLDLVAALD